MKTSLLSTDEYNTFYSGYIDALGEVELLTELRKGLKEIEGFGENVTDSMLNYAYEPGKWTIGEVMIHLIDAERVFQYRALRFARNDKTSLPGFDQDDYVAESGIANRSIGDVIAEFRIVRKSSIALFETFNDDVLLRQGMANGSVMSVRAMGFIICGHFRHHMNILKERYFQA